MNSGQEGSTTTTLAQQQSQFVEAILDAPLRSGPFKHGEGFVLYRRNLLAVAEAAAGVTFPTVRQLLGEPGFRDLIAELLVMHPPAQGDWGEWGKELPSLIGSFTAGDGFPFLAPVAELDWMRHSANRAVNNHFDPSSLHLLESHRIDDIGIGIARHVGLATSIYPLVEIIDWHDDPVGAGKEMCVLESPRPVLVFRSEYRVEQRYISSADHSFLLGLRAGRSVGSLLDELAGQHFDFTAWIAQAINRNLISNLYLIQEKSHATQHSITF